MEEARTHPFALPKAIPRRSEGTLSPIDGKKVSVEQGQLVAVQLRFPTSAIAIFTSCKCRSSVNWQTRSHLASGQIEHPQSPVEARGDAMPACCNAESVNSARMFEDTNARLRPTSLPPNLNASHGVRSNNHQLGAMRTAAAAAAETPIGLLLVCQQKKKTPQTNSRSLLGEVSVRSNRLKRASIRVRSI